MRTWARTDERGMSLVEVLIALTILAFALLGLMPLFASAVKTTASANQLTTANTLVREKFEELSGYPRDDARLGVSVGANTASFVNDLPSWYNPSTGIVSFASTSPGAGWYVFPYVRTYTVEQFVVDLTLPLADQFVRVNAPSAYTVKLVTVTVQPTRGPFPGLRRTTQSLYLRLPNG
jgi:prepilin-type N-terminal cleavage/methylation domain-containing protein